MWASKVLRDQGLKRTSFAGLGSGAVGVGLNSKPPKPPKGNLQVNKEKRLH